MPQTVTVFGDGAWGTAIAQLLARNGHQVLLWCHNKDVFETITTTRVNGRYLPGIKLSERILLTKSLPAALKSQVIFEAIPVQFLRDVLKEARDFVTDDHRWVILSKGIENQTTFLPSQVIADVVPQAAQAFFAVFAGPSYAAEVANQQPTIVTIASENLDYAAQIQALVKNEEFFAELSDDLIGVQACAAYKNVIALVIGMLEGARYGENTRVFALMRCVEEMKNFVQLAGGSLKTIYCAAGYGDVLLTCFGRQSRNRIVGALLGQGNNLEYIRNVTGYIPEGINTAVSLQQYIKKHSHSLPIASLVYQIIFDQKPVACLLEFLVKTSSS